MNTIRNRMQLGGDSGKFDFPPQDPPQTSYNEVGRDVERSGLWYGLIIVNAFLTYLTPIYFLSVSSILNFRVNDIDPSFFISFYAIPSAIAATAGAFTTLTTGQVRSGNRWRAALGSLFAAVWYIIAMLFGVTALVLGIFLFVKGADNNLKTEAQSIWNNNETLLIINYIFAWWPIIVGGTGFVIHIFDAGKLFSSRVSSILPF